MAQLVLLFITHVDSSLGVPLFVFVSVFPHSVLYLNKQYD